MNSLFEDIVIESSYSDAVDYMYDYLTITEAASGYDAFGNEALDNIASIKKKATKLVIAISSIIIILSVATKSVKKAHDNREAEREYQRMSDDEKRKMANAQACNTLLNNLKDLQNVTKDIVSQSAEYETVAKADLDERKKYMDQLGMGNDAKCQRFIKQKEAKIRHDQAEYKKAYTSVTSAYMKEKENARRKLAMFGDASAIAKFKATTSSFKI